MLSLTDPAPARPCPAPFNMAAHVLAAGRARPDHVALSVVSGDAAEDWTHAQLRAAVLNTAGGLLALGLRAGDAILIRLGNTVDVPILYLAALAVDMLPVPSSPQLTAPEITRLAARLHPRMIAAAPGVPLPDSPAQVLDLPALRALRYHAPASFVLGDPERPGYAVFTSGTSGAPRIVLHAHRAVWARRSMHAGWEGLTPADRLLHAGAFNWTYTMGTGLIDPWTLGATALIPAEGTASADLPDLLRRHGATILAAAPGVSRQMLKGRDRLDLPHLRHGLSAGEKLAEPLRARWRATTGTDIHEAYGMSECSTFVSGAPGSPAPPGTLGRPQPGRRVAVVDAAGSPVPWGTPGTLAVHQADPGLMLGYLGDPCATAGRMCAGWYLTGDICCMDAGGNLAYLGRDDDMMNAGGFRVSPVEVEAAVATCPGVTEAAAVDLRVRDDTTVIAVFYTASDDPGEAAILAHCAPLLARYKCPRLALRVDALPRGGNGKLARRLLRAGHERTDP